ncbi:hypothetical protein DSO57_1016776 [Entomophthora muscae]|uniref:Uncharacterized protein n=1 Tax=Entomophthora muscae TaxID=34485 RepID=A0ACC2U393_9FUNG|nr:hypothetical protein DSO57_1016776 [Entomophthora muscae]
MNISAIVIVMIQSGIVIAAGGHLRCFKGGVIDSFSTRGACGATKGHFNKDGCDFDSRDDCVKHGKRHCMPPFTYTC